MVRGSEWMRRAPAVVLLAGAILLGIAAASMVRWSAVAAWAGYVPWQGWIALTGGVALVAACSWWLARVKARTSGSSGGWWWTAVVIVVPVLTLTGISLIMLLNVLDTRQPSVRVDVIKTALSIGAGTGGVVALVLAGRRQWSNERAAEATELDAAERRITELYTKAADQLGSDKAPVRLAGLYALERLAQDNPEHQQTIVNVICAYLRMPYTPPADPTQTPDTTTEETAASPAETAEQRQEREQQEQEKQVRLTAQRILTTHLRPANPKHWPKIDLDLTNATLLDFDLHGCHLHGAHFTEARFNGYAWFDRAHFSEDAWFDRAEFSGTAGFAEAQFSGQAEFGRAQFSGQAEFGRAQFSGDARFKGTQFSGHAEFPEAQFSRPALFHNAQFAVGADLEYARVRVDMHENVQRSWPDGWVEAPPANPEDGQLPEQEGTWGFLVLAAEADRTQ